MSRLEIAGRMAGARLVVGWDQPMLTYSAHVFYSTEGPENEGPHVWFGGQPRELHELDDFKRVIHPFVDLPQSLAITLYGDRDEGR